jgi:hypothetical protein
VCFETRLIVELDGGQHTEQQTEDTVRTTFLQSQGFRVVRFWNNEVLGNIEGVLDSIRSVLTLPSPCPLPQGERELALYVGAAVVTKSNDLAEKLPLPLRERVG